LLERFFIPGVVVVSVGVVNGVSVTVVALVDDSVDADFDTALLPAVDDCIAAVGVETLVSALDESVLSAVVDVVWVDAVCGVAVVPDVGDAEVPFVDD